MFLPGTLPSEVALELPRVGDGDAVVLRDLDPPVRTAARERDLVGKLVRDLPVTPEEGLLRQLRVHLVPKGGLPEEERDHVGRDQPDRDEGDPLPTR